MAQRAGALWRRVSPRGRRRLLVLLVGVVAVGIVLAVPGRAAPGRSGVEWRVLGVLVAVALVSTVWATVLGAQSADELLLNLGSEMAGAVLTYVLLQMVAGGAARKAELIAQLDSDVRDVAVAAAEELRVHGWITDGSLEDVWLGYGNLEGVDLGNANLREAGADQANLRRANLEGANLEGASLWKANLEDASLESANLKGAYMAGINLEGARLWFATLEGATVTSANLKDALMEPSNLSGVLLSGSNLEGATVAAEQLAEAASLAGATLPDGTELSGEGWRAEFEAWRAAQEEQESGG